MPSSTSSSNLPAYVYIPILGTPFWVLFHPDEDYQPFTTLYFGHHLSPISGHIAPAIALNAYPPPGLTGPLYGNQQAHQVSAASSSWQLPPVQSQASSSWQQPAHLVEPPRRPNLSFHWPCKYKSVKSLGIFTPPYHHFYPTRTSLD